MMKIFQYSSLLTAMLLFASEATVCLAQMQTMDVLAPLKDALQKAGAAALTSTQETSIKALIDDFRNAHQASAPSTTMQAALATYENAILNSDRSTAALEAKAIAAAQADEMATRETESATLAINILGYLNSTQVNALITQQGKSGLVRLLLGLAGGTRGGPGPGGPPPQ
jgi:hypothetical protein